MTKFERNEVLAERLLARANGEEFYIGSSGTGLEKLLKASPAGVLKGSVLSTGELVVWTETGHSEAYKEIPEMRKLAKDVLYNFYLNAEWDPMGSGVPVGRNVVESSASNDKGFSSEQNKIFPKASGRYRKEVVDTVLKKIPSAEWVLFDDAVVDGTGEVVEKMKTTKGGSWLRVVSNILRDHGTEQGVEEEPVRRPSSNMAAWRED